MMRIFIEDSFDAAHFLPNVSKLHQCSRVHGHTYRIRLEFGGEVDELLGWIIDYSDVKPKWECVKKMLDHRDLNEVIKNPTCENIAEWIAAHISVTLPPQTKLCRMEIRETERCGVVWEAK